MANGQFHLTLNNAEPRLHTNDKNDDEKIPSCPATIRLIYHRRLRHHERKKRKK